jgi:nucleoside-diphosphate-sugar epimerase
MRIFLAGASGVIGIRLLPLLVSAGHVVAGMTRSPGKSSSLQALGAQPVLCDVYDAEGLRAAVVAFQPDAVMHQLTDLPDDADRLPEFAARNDRMLGEGTRNLLAAARAAGTRRIIAQSIAWELPGERGLTYRDHEQAVLDAGGVVVRYGQLYGPGTYYPTERPAAPRIGVDEAACRTLALLEAPPGIVEVVDQPIDSDQIPATATGE